jgi:hypothetical protein
MGMEFGGAVSGGVILGGAAVYRCDNRQEPDGLLPLEVQFRIRARLQACRRSCKMNAPSGAEAKV